MTLISSVLLAVACTIPGAMSAPASTQKTLAFTNPAEARQADFGVGFDLTASYGSAAVSFSNGTVSTIAKIQAEDGYKEVLRRLSLYSSRHPSPPCDNLGDSWGDMPRQYLRKARKAVGLPASSDVGFLAKMLTDLRARVEERVGPIKSAGMTTMNLVALYDEDLHDAFDYLGLEYITFPVGWVGHSTLYETSAAYAGYGFGLCADYTHPESCKEEQYAMPHTAVMAVLFTPNVLTVSLSVLKSVYALWEPDYRYLIDFELGYEGEDAADAADDGGRYWEKVKMRLEEIMVSNPFYDRPAKVVLMGDCVGNEMFRQTLLTVLGEQMEELPEVLSSDSDVVAARGIAEMAKRMLFKPSETVEVRES